MPQFEIIRQRMNRITMTPEPSVETIDAFDILINSDGCLQALDGDGVLLLGVPKGIWLEVTMVPETAVQQADGVR